MYDHKIAANLTYLELLRPFLMVASIEKNAMFEDQRALISPRESSCTFYVDNTHEIYTFYFEYDKL